MNIRRAEARDLSALTAIYNYEVRNGSATFDTEEQTEEARRVWMEKHNVKNHPLFVAETASGIAGYASLSTFSEKEAYNGTVELSVYVDFEARGRGIGRALMEHTIAWAKADPDTHVIISIITSTNVASLSLHMQLGFSYCGTLHRVGYKNGAWLDVDYYELNVEAAEQPEGPKNPLVLP